MTGAFRLQTGAPMPFLSEALARIRPSPTVAITAAVHAVLFEQLDPIDAIAQLMNRPPREEAVG